MSSENSQRFATLLRWNTLNCLFSVFKDFMEIEDEKETSTMMSMFV